MMDVAGIDAAFLTSAAGMCADLDRSKIVNDKAKQAERDYPGRFIGAAHAHPLGGAEAFKELARCAHELGFPGVVITSEADGLFLDAPEFEPFWAEAEKLGMFVFVHPALKLNFPQQFDAYDTARSVGREFSLIMATIRLINSGVFDRHPKLIVHMAHLGGGIASMLGRIRSFRTRNSGARAATPSMAAARRISTITCATTSIFDTAGFCGAIGASRRRWWKFPPPVIVFATDYPQEIRAREVVRDFVQRYRKLGTDGEKILSGNVDVLLKRRYSRRAA